MAEANRASWALFVGTTIALVAVAGTACSAVYLRRHFRLLEADARERLRPALARTECHVVETPGEEGGAGPRHVELEVTNVGAVAAVGAGGRIKSGVGAGVDSISNPRTAYWSVGALAPNSNIRTTISAETTGNKDTGKHSWFGASMEYSAIGGANVQL